MVWFWLLALFLHQGGVHSLLCCVNDPVVPCGRWNTLHDRNLIFSDGKGTLVGLLECCINNDGERIEYGDDIRGNGSKVEVSRTGEECNNMIFGPYRVGTQYFKVGPSALTSWEMSEIRDMSGIFKGAILFNQP